MFTKIGALNEKLFLPKVHLCKNFFNITGDSYTFDNTEVINKDCTDSLHSYINSKNGFAFLLNKEIHLSITDKIHETYFGFYNRFMDSLGFVDLQRIVKSYVPDSERDNIVFGQCDSFKDDEIAIIKKTGFGDYLNSTINLEMMIDLKNEDLSNAINSMENELDYKIIFEDRLYLQKLVTYSDLLEMIPSPEFSGEDYALLIKKSKKVDDLIVYTDLRGNILKIPEYTKEAIGFDKKN